MPAITSQNLVLGLALLLTIVGVAGLAPAFFDAFRQRRLITQLANLEVDGETADPEDGPEQRNDEHDLLPRRMATMMPQTTREPAAAAYVSSPTPLARPQPVTLAAVNDVALDEAEDVEMQASVEDPVDDEEAEPEVAVAVEASEDEEDEDDLLAMFKDAKARSSTPVALADAIESVAASDLLAQARELRDMLRRAA